MANLIILKGTGSIHADRISINTNFSNINLDIETLFDNIANIQLTPGPTGPAGESFTISPGSKGATDSGNVGEISYDLPYAYLCIDTNTWVRFEVETSW